MVALLLSLALHVEPSSAPAFANELALYEREALELRLRPLDFGHELRRNQVKLKLGGFGQGADHLFKSVPESLVDIQKYRGFKAGGLAGLVIGIGMLTVSSIVLTLAIVQQKPLDVPLFVSLLVIGLDVSGVGIGLMIFAPNYLQRAVATYNEVVVARALQ